DLDAVDEGAVAAAEVADAHVGRVDVQQAVVPRHQPVVVVVGQPHLAVSRPTDQARGALVKAVLLVLQGTLADHLEDDAGRHGKLPVGRRCAAPNNFARNQPVSQAQTQGQASEGPRKLPWAGFSRPYRATDTKDPYSETRGVALAPRALPWAGISQ